MLRSRKRPVYETPVDRSREAELIGVAASLWNARAIKNPKFSVLDYGLYRDGVLVALAEAKERHYRHDRFDTFMVSAEKLHNAKLWALHGIPSFIVVGYTDCIRYVSLGQPATFGWGGRKDRGDPKDMEIVAHFPIDAMGTLVRYDEGVT